ncbi:hypothetical protein [Clostridium chromiireducens]|nr:hypothetical protein [Clostridium chromiireducens]
MFIEMKVFESYKTASKEWNNFMENPYLEINGYISEHENFLEK